MNYIEPIESARGWGNYKLPWIVTGKSSGKWWVVVEVVSSWLLVHAHTCTCTCLNYIISFSFYIDGLNRPGAFAIVVIMCTPNVKLEKGAFRLLSSQSDCAGRKWHEAHRSDPDHFLYHAHHQNTGTLISIILYRLQNPSIRYHIKATTRKGVQSSQKITRTRKMQKTSRNMKHFINTPRNSSVSARRES